MDQTSQKILSSYRQYYRYELQHDKANKMTCVPSEDSDQDAQSD